MAPEPDILATTNAALNAGATVLLAWGRVLVKRGRVDWHRRVMLSAFALSALFLALYLARKTVFGFESQSFEAGDVAMTVYRFILATHVSLAMAVPVLAILLLRLGLQDRREAHRRLARWAWPVWMYVSVTGVVIYVLLYHLNPMPI
jgi:uncharacterized membrane protein YozB (DUF420 family)